MAYRDEMVLAITKLSDVAAWLGDMATWLGALATVGALAFALVAARHTKQLYEIELKKDQRTVEDQKLAAEDRRLAEEDRRRADVERQSAHEEKRREQAAKVSTWYGLAIHRPDLPGGKSRQFWMATVRNASDLPVYAVKVEFHYVTTQPNGPSATSARSFGEIPVLPPGDEKQLPMSAETLATTDSSGHANYVTAISFRDAAGNRWYRDAWGALTEQR